MMIDVKVIILAGGFGKRLKPISSIKKPKQFLKSNNSYSLFQQALLRNSKLGKPCIIINKIHKEIAMLQLKEINYEGDIIVEDNSKNTAAAITCASFFYKNQGIKYLLTLPCDQYIENTDLYINNIKKAYSYVQNYNLVMIGSKATVPDVNYGYIQVGKRLEENTYLIEKFIEKPNLKLAERLVSLGNYYRNSGIYFINRDFLIQKIRLLNYDLYLSIYKAYKSLDKRSNTAFNIKYPQDMAALSLEHAVMENVNCGILIESSTKWKDLGNYESLSKFNSLINLNNKVSKIVQKSWGYYEIIWELNLYKIKKLTIKPMQKISLQYHHHRAEKWIIASGCGEVRVDELQKTAHQGDEFFIPINTLHQVRNIDNVCNLEIIEIQIGSYLSEGDIVRINE